MMFWGGTDVIHCEEQGCEGYMVLGHMDPIDGTEIRCNQCGVIHGDVRVGGRLL